MTKSKLTYSESSKFVVCRCGMKFFTGKSNIGFKLHKKKCVMGSNIEMINCSDVNGRIIKGYEHAKDYIAKSNRFSTF